MNTVDYEAKLESIIEDPNKFMICDPNQSESIKKRINEIGEKYKLEAPQVYRQLRVLGEFPPGHLYGLPKVHKNASDPPLRPIVSMSGTVTHSIASYINDLIRPYINSKYIIRSSDEFLAAFKDVKLSGNNVLCSLDVESLFTNVPVNETIDIIINHVYNHATIPPPCIRQNDLRNLLVITTQETPFSFKNKTYVQKDGVSRAALRFCLVQAVWHYCLQNVSESHGFACC